MLLRYQSRRMRNRSECRLLYSIDGLVFNSYQVCLNVTEWGEGIALGWARSVKSKIDEGKLARIQGMTMQLPESVFVYRRKLAGPDPVVDQFIQILKMNIDSVI